MPATATVTAAAGGIPTGTSRGSIAGKADFRRPARPRDMKTAIRADTTGQTYQGRELGGSSRGYLGYGSQTHPAMPQQYASNRMPTAIGRPQPYQGTPQSSWEPSAGLRKWIPVVRGPPAAVLDVRSAAGVWLEPLRSTHGELRRRTQPGILGSRADLPGAHAEFRPRIQPASSKCLRGVVWTARPFGRIPSFRRRAQFLAELRRQQPQFWRQLATASAGRRHSFGGGGHSFGGGHSSGGHSSGGGHSHHR